MKFKHELGSEAKSKVYGMKGILTARSENLYGCNRYFIQQSLAKDGKLGEGAWFDEGDIEVIKKMINREIKDTGGPASKIK